MPELKKLRRVQVCHGEAELRMFSHHGGFRHLFSGDRPQTPDLGKAITYLPLAHHDKISQTEANWGQGGGEYTTLSTNVLLA